MKERRISGRKLKVLLVTVLLFGSGLTIGSVANLWADSFLHSPQPGSADDPLVTKSYVDEQIRKALSGKAPELPEATATQELAIVQLKPGQTLVAHAGTEMIVRNGRTVVVSDSVDGIPDVTAGKDIKNGELVSNNHLLISPVEGRGIRPHEDVTGTIFVMVRGNYTIR
jgi:hypothetical protein